MLEARARGTDELRRLLLRKGEPEVDVDAAIVRLTEAGLLDDAEYARQMARSKGVGAGQSKRRIQQDLSRRGCGPRGRDGAIDASVRGRRRRRRHEAIERVARKKLPIAVALLDSDADAKRRLYGFLARRGYDADDIARVLRAILSAEERPRTGRERPG